MSFDLVLSNCRSCCQNFDTVQRDRVLPMLGLGHSVSSAPHPDREESDGRFSPFHPRAQKHPIATGLHVDPNQR